MLVFQQKTTMLDPKTKIRREPPSTTRFQFDEQKTARFQFYEQKISLPIIVTYW